ncbi:ABC transporter substrate-binding protein [Meiothermus hypogaeus]|uniref:ABC transporter substrate-binding protein n=2 Tax=Meiothermus hypogaeus TaxID=884155 RepID=A0A511R2Q5_9DEIN|nr:ABC transporter substrate-binding protein [Meiothermus hypogaeus]RIH76081.1 ABC transporter, substrate-binding protein, aliphatic sulfonates family [Meiothermus hypogaeus]GEM83891.1 ABC transporter substrate-binding protein [Meiothermus hypogaeus NBRC 106114]GIW36433.1 MAG: ABC transporter substrate-binding protein [Meiothermus sp.]
MKRGIGVWGLVLIAAVLLSAGAWAQGVKTIRVGLQAGGTFSWVIYAIERFGIDKQLGIEVREVTYPSKPATQLALRAGEVQVTVDDFIEAVRMQQQGIPARAVYPYSLVTGGVVVKADGPISTVADLKGKTIGAQSLGDKSLLILRALAVSKYGFDPQKDSRVIAAAPPLMSELLRKGEIDAGLPFWHFVARQVATGESREIISAKQMLREMGAPVDLPLLLIIARNDLDKDALQRLLRAVQLANARMKTTDAFWTEILERRLYALPDPSLMPAVRRRWEAGLPTRWDAGVVVGLNNLVQRMVQVAGAEVVGVQRFDPRAYTTEFVPAD